MSYLYTCFEFCRKNLGSLPVRPRPHECDQNLILFLKFVCNTHLGPKNTLHGKKKNEHFVSKASQKCKLHCFVHCFKFQIILAVLFAEYIKIPWKLCSSWWIMPKIMPAPSINAYNLGWNKWEIYIPPTPFPRNQGWGKWRVLAFARLSSLICGGWGLIKYCSILFCPRL